MKPSYCFLVAVLICVGTIFGCKSPTSAVSGAPYVTITPSNLRGIEFIMDTFQARIFNHDFAQTYFGWNLGDSTLIPPYQRPGEDFEAEHIYTKPGIYIVTVNAFDLYSNNLIATTSTSVTIDTAKSSVEIIPQFYNGSLPTNNFGFTPFMLSVKTSIPDNELFQFWDFGDGTADSFLSGKITHVFPHPGSYILKVDMYQKSGVYVGTDTAFITINLPSFNLADFKVQSGKVESYLVVDSSYSIFPSVKNFLPLAIGEPFKGANISSSWVGNNFIVQYSYGDQNGQENETLTGSISDDGMTINSVTISAHPWPYTDISGTRTYSSFEFRASNLKFFAVTPNFLIYKISGDSLKNNLQDISLSGHPGNAGKPDSWSSFIKQNNNTGQPESIPQCILVFSKQ